MKREEVVDKLLAEEKIQPSLTELAWRKLEEQHHEFFRTYHLMVALKLQITKFNVLLEKHAELSQQHQNAVISPPNSLTVSISIHYSRVVDYLYMPNACCG